MSLLREVDAILSSLRTAFTRHAAFRWFVLAVFGFLLRFEGDGVTGLARSLGLASCDYFNLLHFFHSQACVLPRLSACWVRTVLERAPALRFRGHLTFVCDAIKVPKAGQKMPAVKGMSQESQNNNKPDYIMGHFWTSVGLLAGVAGHCFCIPLRLVIHDGLKRSPSEKATLSDKTAAFLRQTVSAGSLVIADAVYSCRKVLDALTQAEVFYLGSVRSDVAAQEPATPLKEPAGPGRRRKYGDWVKLRTLYSQKHLFQSADLTLYSELRNVRFLSRDLWWLQHFVRFVVTIFPDGARKILLCTDLSMSAEEIILAYSMRFRIESMFKALMRVLLAGSYHFWMKMMTPQKWGAGNQYLHRKSAAYRAALTRKVEAYERYVNVAAIGLGILQLIALRRPVTVWARFTSWLRTKPVHQIPSENVVRQTLRAELARISSRSQPDLLLGQFLPAPPKPPRTADPLSLTG